LIGGGVSLWIAGRKLERGSPDFRMKPVATPSYGGIVASWGF
jgi:hypothetical protein